MPQAKTDDWATPQTLYDELNAEFQFALDAAASSHNYKHENWFGLDHPLESHRDGLKADWSQFGGAVYCNPPYGKALKHWAHKAYLESAKQTVVLLLPSRTDTVWFHSWIYPHSEIRFIKGRVKYGAGTAPAPFPSFIAVCRPEKHLL